MPLACSVLNIKVLAIVGYSEDQFRIVMSYLPPLILHVTMLSELEIVTVQLSRLYLSLA